MNILSTYERLDLGQTSERFRFVFISEGNGMFSPLPRRRRKTRLEEKNGKGTHGWTKFNTY